MSTIGPEDDTPPMGARPEFLKPGFTKTAEGSHLVIDTRQLDNALGPLDGIAPELPPVPVPDFSAVPLTPNVDERAAAEALKPVTATPLVQRPRVAKGEVLAPKGINPKPVSD